MSQNYYPPEFMQPAFHCPLCGVYSNQQWKNVLSDLEGHQYKGVEPLRLCLCVHCGSFSIWYNGKMIEPSVGGVPLPNEDLPDDIKIDYIEARDILSKSPRGAAALLRLGVQKLCKHLGEKGKNINEDIASLVSKGLPVKIQQSLDFVRVIGNHAVHPGQIDLTDDRETAATLFRLLNIITEVMISQPKQIETLYGSLPANKLKEIEIRDNKDRN